MPDPDAVLRRIDETREHWARWRTVIDYDGPWQEAVVRGAFVHKLLTQAATGGLLAAATTSLPERIGGKRNFDYQFSWVRDTGFALDALTAVGLRGEVHAAMSFLLNAVQRTSPDVQVFYTLGGEPAASTMERVSLWSGYRGSAPVQLGNSAAGQRQLGAYGDLLERAA